MNDFDVTKIGPIKKKVIAMLEERHSLETGIDATASPSQFWSDICSSFDYMLELPDQYYSKLRLHTFHCTGDCYVHYDGHRDADAFRAEVDFDSLTKNIPASMVLNEPKGGIGFSYDDGRIVNIDILRYQRVINTLYHRGILAHLSNTADQPPHSILEIGAGYGALPHHLSNVLGKANYVIVDLPETLLFSASYISLHNPQKKIYLYDRRDFHEFINSTEARSYDFILIPNYRLHDLDQWRFELAINMISFQEMQANQVNEYLDFIVETCTGTLYCWNIDFHVRHGDLPEMSKMLIPRFKITEMPPPTTDISKSSGSGNGSVSFPIQGTSLRRYFERGKEYLCTPNRSVPGSRSNRMQLKDPLF